MICVNLFHFLNKDWETHEHNISLQRIIYPNRTP